MPQTRMTQLLLEFRNSTMSLAENLSNLNKLKTVKTTFIFLKPVYKITNKGLVDIGCQWLPVIY